MDNIIDIAIIGGGYAGLSAALLLGRYLRNTIIFDVVNPRKSYIHGYLGFEKSPIEDVIQKAWKDVLQYIPVKRIVEKVEKDSDNDLFLITTTKSTKISNQESGISRKRIDKSRYLIIATEI